jgi:hypothetical protein
MLLPVNLSINPAGPGREPIAISEARRRGLKNVLRREYGLLLACPSMLEGIGYLSIFIAPSFY